MAYPLDSQENQGFYVPVIQNFDVSQIYQMQVGTDEFKEFLVRVALALNNTASALNAKENGLYVTQELANNAQFFGTASVLPKDYRQGYTQTYNVGALGAGITQKAHNLGAGATGIAGLNYTFVEKQAFACNPSTTALPANCHNYSIPWVGAAGAYISMDITDLNIVINNNSGLTFTTCVVVLKYLKQ